MLTLVSSSRARPFIHITKKENSISIERKERRDRGSGEGALQREKAAYIETVVASSRLGPQVDEAVWDELLVGVHHMIKPGMPRIVLFVLKMIAGAKVLGRPTDKKERYAPAFVHRHFNVVHPV